MALFQTALNQLRKANAFSFGQIPTTARAFSSAVESVVSTPSEPDLSFVEGRIVETTKRDIRGSPQKLNLLAKQIRRLTAEQALIQMQFSQKKKASIVQKTIQNAVNLADIKYGIEPNCLEIEKCFVGKGKFLKRMKIMGKGNTGVMHRKFSHLTVVLREIEPSHKKVTDVAKPKKERLLKKQQRFVAKRDAKKNPPTVSFP